MKALLWIVFGLAALAQWAAPFSAIWGHEQTLSKGTLYKIKCAAPDPYDPLRGRYLAVRPEQRDAKVLEKADLPEHAHIFGTLTVGNDGLATVSELLAKAPPSGDYIRLKSTYGYGEAGTRNFDWPFERFYINEKLAPEADKWFAENIRTEKGIVAEVRVLNGRAVLSDLSFDGKSFREILKERTLTTPSH